MQETLPLRVPKLPFYLCDAILLATAWFIVWQGTLPLGRWEILGSVVCVMLGAGVAVLPFVLEYKALARLAEATTLASGLAQIKHAETIAARIAQATDNWQAVHEQSGKTVASAREISEHMASEVREFTQFLKNTNDSEKATLRLEVEKLRRGEGEWVQIIVRMLDHTFALYSAGVRSGQPRLIEQFTQFQNACREAARRAGLVPFVAAADEVFDPKRHQTPDGKAPPGETRVRETVATGFTFQGQLIRPAMVLIQTPTDAADEGSGAQNPPDSAASDPGPVPEQTLL